MLYLLEQVPGPTYVKETLLLMLSPRLMWPLQALCLKVFMDHLIFPPGRITTIMLWGPCRVTNGPREKMAILSLIYGVQRLVRGCLLLQQYCFNRQGRECIFVLISTGALLWCFLSPYPQYLMGSKVCRQWSNKFLKMLVSIILNIFLPNEFL